MFNQALSHFIVVGSCNRDIAAELGHATAVIRSTAASALGVVEESIPQARWTSLALVRKLDDADGNHLEGAFLMV